MYSLEDLGWGPFFDQQTQQLQSDGLLPMRVAEEQRGAYVLWSADGAFEAVIPGRMLHKAEGRKHLPAVGDWLLARRLPGEPRAVVERVLGRRSALSRKVAGERTDEQVMAANVDLIFVVASLNRELNLRRLERYLAVTWDSGATPVLVLNKADLCDDREVILRNVEAVTPGVEVFLTSAATGEGIDALRPTLARGLTAVLVGSSGVGKSSIVNSLLERQAQGVKGIRSDDKGRHTTTVRQMLVLPGGAVIIDTPGLRELQLWDAGDGLGKAFADIEDLAEGCGFRDCSHSSEPDCAVQAAIGDGMFDRGRLESYRKLQREQTFIAGKKDERLRAEGQKKWKQIAKGNRARLKARRR
ncbi:MAG: ribosome small subunit-dependent GTPase A [Chloroflexi bacterium]|nr:ribosome small subunit-dependent GTPase A [Chloroflexota bacterium]